jgi:hypothetical protein
LAVILDNMGFANTYDFIYVPTVRGWRKMRGNLGYAFVNFVDEFHAKLFSRAIIGRRFDETGSSKVTTVKPARIQGVEAWRKHRCAQEALQNARLGASQQHSTQRPLHELLATSSLAYSCAIFCSEAG